MSPMIFYFYGVDSIRDEPRMVGGERQRAYRYGMTLLCVGALFNWLGFSDSGSSDPIRFIGYTCLASGALLICMAICFWANAGNSSPHHLERRDGLTRAQRDMVVSIVERSRGGAGLAGLGREKPPDYSAVADLSPPPSYDDAIRLSPAYLIPTASGAMTMGERAPEYSVSCSVVNELERPGAGGGLPAAAQDSCSLPVSPPPRCLPVPQQGELSAVLPEDKSCPADSPLSMVIRLSSRLLRRTLSNVDRRADEEEPAAESPPVRRSSSFQDLKNT